MTNLKNNSFNRFYIFSVIFWIISIILFFSLTYIRDIFPADRFPIQIIEIITVSVLPMIIVSIPIIIILTIPIRFGEKIIDSIHKKVNKDK